VKNLLRVLSVAFVAAVVFLAAHAGSAAAGVRFNVDVLWNPNPDDGAQVFLHATNEAFPMPRERVSAVFHEINDPYDDYPTLAFIAFNAHVDIGTVWTYKRKGHDWVNVMYHFGVPPSALFVVVQQPPGPPYGRAYGYWRKHGNRLGPEQLSGDDIRYWVRMRALAGYGQVAPARVYEMQRSGQRCDAIAVNQYREKHGNQGNQGNGKGRGKAWGHRD